MIINILRTYTNNATSDSGSFTKLLQPLAPAHTSGSGTYTKAFKPLPPAHAPGTGPPMGVLVPCSPAHAIAGTSTATVAANASIEHDGTSRVTPDQRNTSPKSDTSKYTDRSSL